MMNRRQGEGCPGENELVSDIVLAIADETRSDPVEMTPPLGSVIDVDALVRLVEHSTEGVSITFEYLGLHVSVRHDGDFEHREIGVVN